MRSILLFLIVLSPLSALAATINVRVDNPPISPIVYQAKILRIDIRSNDKSYGPFVDILTKEGTCRVFKEALKHADVTAGELANLILTGGEEVMIDCMVEAQPTKTDLVNAKDISIEIVGKDVFAK